MSSQFYFELKPGMVLGGRYELTEFLGRGAFGIVYRAHDRDLDLDCALKLLSSQWTSESEQVRRFKAEIKIGRKIRHENVCQIYDFGEFQEIKFISMEFVDGQTLTARLQAGPPLGLAEGIDIVRQICAGLEAAHRVGVVHRDLKLDNVMIDRGGRVKVMDFGIARATDMTRLTSTDKILGTTLYMPPEQWRGEDVDARTDLYALGVMMYILFARRPPFQGENNVALFYQHLNQLPPPVLSLAPELPPELARLIEGCMAKDREGRPRSAAQLAEALAAVPLDAEQRAIRLASVLPTSPGRELDGSSEKQTLMQSFRETQSVGRRAARGWSRRAVGLAVILVALAGGVAGGVWISGPRGSRSGQGSSEEIPSPGPAEVVPPRVPFPSSTPTAPPHAAPAGPSTTSPAAVPPASSPVGAVLSVPTFTPRVDVVSALGPELSPPAPSQRLTPTRRASPRRSPTPQQQASETTPSRPTPAQLEPTAPPTPAVAGSGFVKFRLDVWANVRVDGRDAGSTPMKPLELAPGQHRIVLENPETQARVERTVEVRSGQTATVEASLLNGTLDIETQPPARATLKLPDGSVRDLGTTPVSAQVPGGQDVQLVLEVEGRQQAFIVRVPGGARQRFQKKLTGD
jgi:serine/threonine protein kinase